MRIGGRRPTPTSSNGAGGPSANSDLGFVATSLRVPERMIRLSIAAMIPMFGAIAAVMMFSGEGPGDTASRTAVIVVIATTIPAAGVIARADLTPLWWTRRPKRWGLDSVFVIYGDIGVSVVLFTFTSPEAALFGALLLAILSAYAAYFCSVATRNLHIIVTTTVIASLSVLTWRTDEYSTAGVLGRFLVAVAVVNGTVILQSIFASAVRHAIRDTLVHAHQDQLTLLWNRRGFTYWAMAMVDKSPCLTGILIVDLDHYKTINDTHGHRVGDEVLQLAARRLQDAAGPSSVVARTGGDEFAIAANTDLDGMIRLAEAIRTRIAQPDDVFPVTASIGAAAGSAYVETSDRLGLADHVISTLLQAADAALYEAKRAGRNRIAYTDLDNPDHCANTIDVD